MGGIKTAEDFIGTGHKPNFQVTGKDGNTYWISRSCAVCAAVVCADRGQFYILVNRRGEGTPDWRGYWNIPCGYVDFGETCEQACSREILEECGLHIDPSMFKLWRVVSDPEDSPKQNITIRYIAKVPAEYMNARLTDAMSEEKEVDGIKWIPYESADEYEWAFNHRNVLDDLNRELSDSENL